jgi:hypothetical protein
MGDSFLQKNVFQKVVFRNWMAERAVFLARTGKEPQNDAKYADPA